MKKLYGFGIVILLILSGKVSAYANTDIIYAQALAKNGIIVDHSSEPEKYRFEDTISRSELVGIALKMRGTVLPEKYTCKGYYSDVTTNDWVCRAVEISADTGLISRERKAFDPAKDISKSEALSILMKSMGITIEPDASLSGYSPDVVQWQANVVQSAIKHNIINSAQDFAPNRPATRAEVFGMAVSIAISVTKNIDSMPTPEMHVSFAQDGDTRKWSSQYTNWDSTFLINELTPEGSTLDGWKELLTHRVDFVKDTTITDFVATWKSWLVKMDANITVSLLPVKDNTLVATYSSEALNERGIAKFFVGSDGIYMILYSVRFKDYDPDYFKVWTKIINNATLVQK